MTLHMQPTRTYICTKRTENSVAVPVALVLEPVKKLTGLMARPSLIYFAERSSDAATLRRQLANFLVFIGYKLLCTYRGHQTSDLTH